MPWEWLERLFIDTVNWLYETVRKRLPSRVQNKIEDSTVAVGFTNCSLFSSLWKVPKCINMIYVKSWIRERVSLTLSEGRRSNSAAVWTYCIFVSPWSLTESGLCAATNNVSRQKPLTRIYICDGVMGLLVVLCLWLIDCRGHLSLKSLYRPCLEWRVDDLKLSFYCAVELIDLSPFLPPSFHVVSFVFLSCLLARCFKCTQSHEVCESLGLVKVPRVIREGWEGDSNFNSI